LERLVFSRASRTRNRNLVIEISKAEKGTDYQIQNRKSLPQPKITYFYVMNVRFSQLNLEILYFFLQKLLNIVILGEIGEFRVGFRLKSGNIWIKWILIIFLILIMSSKFDYSRCSPRNLNRGWFFGLKRLSIEKEA